MGAGKLKLYWQSGVSCFCLFFHLVLVIVIHYLYHDHLDPIKRAWHTHLLLEFILLQGCLTKSQKIIFEYVAFLTSLYIHLELPISQLSPLKKNWWKVLLLSEICRNHKWVSLYFLKEIKNKLYFFSFFFKRAILLILSFFSLLIRWQCNMEKV